jgi:histidyl-tRNA synthetase
MDERYAADVMALAQDLRRLGLAVRVHMGGGKLKTQMKRADASGARFALILGEDEIAAGEVSLKWLREDRPQERLSRNALLDRLGA